MFQAEPFGLSFYPNATALMMIDIQGDVVEHGGFGEALGNEVFVVRSAINPCQRVLNAARSNGLLIIHTCERHGP